MAPGVARTAEPQAFFTLSICIPTYNRAEYIADALESILCQITDECEVVVSDNASTDDTENVVISFMKRFDRLRYARHPQNLGPDRNIDSVVAMSRGKYCWLLSDDDVMNPGAIGRVLGALRQEPSLVLMDFETRNLTLNKVVLRRWIGLESDRSYTCDELDRLLIDVNLAALYLSIIVINRALWLEREREPYFDSLCLQTAVIFQKPLPWGALLLADALVINRRGNMPQYCGTRDLFFQTLPSVFDRSAVSRSARNRAAIAAPWRHPGWLLVLRGLGAYSISTYRASVHQRVGFGPWALLPLIIALSPRSPTARLLILSYALRGKRESYWLSLLKGDSFQ